MRQRAAIIFAIAGSFLFPGVSAAQQNEAPAADGTGAEGLMSALLDRILVDDPAEMFRRAVLTGLVLVAMIVARYLSGKLSARISARITGEGGESANRAMSVGNRVKRIASAAILIAAFFALLEVWGIGLSGLAPAGEGGLIKALAVILVAWALWHAARIGIETLLLSRGEGGAPEAATQRAKTLAPLLTGAARIGIALLAGLIVLSEFGINIAPLLAGAGILGLAVGFGAQSLVKDMLTGIFILFEDSIAVGDVVSVAGHSGLVESMSLREMRLRDLRGTVHIVPYGEIGTIQNLTRDFSFALLDIGVAYQEDADRVMAVMLEVAEEQRGDPELAEVILEPMEMLGLNEFADSAVVIRARIRTRPLQQWRVQRDYNLRLKRRFDAEGIEIPFPHRTLYFGADKDGKATALRMRLLDEKGKQVAARQEPQDGREPSES